MSVREVAERIAKHRKAHKVETDEGSLWVRGLTGTERVSYYASINNPNATQAEQLSVNQRMVASQLCGEDGSPVFADTDAGRAEGLAIVMEWDVAAFVAPCVDKILTVSGLKADSTDETEKK